MLRIALDRKHAGAASAQGRGLGRAEAPVQAACIRLARPADAATLAALEAAHSTAGSWSAAEYLRLCRPGSGDPGGACREYILVAEHAGELAGFIALARVVDEGSIHNVLVRHSHRRLGLGRQLVRAAMRREAGRLERWLLEVRASNLAARQLYRGLGFIEDGRRPGYYPCGEGREDAILMSMFTGIDQA